MSTVALHPKRALKGLLLRTVWSFGDGELARVLASLGIRPGDAVMLHSSWRADAGYRGSPSELVEAFIKHVGPAGTLAMMSMPFHNETAADYLRRGKAFDVRRTVSRVGLLTEIFRRRADVMRSLHPTHSVAATGARAGWLLAGHDACLSPFGSGSPFDRLREAAGKVVLYDTGFLSMTFTHYLEDRIASTIPVPLYEPEPVPAVMVDEAGSRREIAVQVLSEAANAVRRDGLLEALLRQRGVLRARRLGRVTITSVDAAAAVEVVEAAAAESGSPFHVLPDTPPRADRTAAETGR